MSNRLLNKLVMIAGLAVGVVSTANAGGHRDVCDLDPSLAGCESEIDNGDLVRCLIDSKFGPLNASGNTGGDVGNTEGTDCDPGDPSCTDGSDDLIVLVTEQECILRGGTIITDN
jgi:hypothetical protein